MDKCFVDSLTNSIIKSYKFNQLKEIDINVTGFDITSKSCCDKLVKLVTHTKLKKLR